MHTILPKNWKQVIWYSARFPNDWICSPAARRWISKVARLSFLEVSHRPTQSILRLQKSDWEPWVITARRQRFHSFPSNNEGRVHNNVGRRDQAGRLREFLFQSGHKRQSNNSFSANLRKAIKNANTSGHCKLAEDFMLINRARQFRSSGPRRMLQWLLHILILHIQSRKQTLLLLPPTLAETGGNIFGDWTESVVYLNCGLYLNGSIMHVSCSTFNLILLSLATFDSLDEL